MPLIRISEKTKEFLEYAGLTSESADGTLQRLLGLSTGEATKRNYTKRSSLLGKDIYNCLVLNAFTTENANSLMRKDILKFVESKLFGELDISEKYPLEDEHTKNGQPRWKNRVSASLNQLQTQNCLARTGRGEKNWEGGIYTLVEGSESGDYGVEEWAKWYEVHWDIDASKLGLWLSYSNKFLDDIEKPKELIGDVLHRKWTRELERNQNRNNEAELATYIFHRQKEWLEGFNRNLPPENKAPYADIDNIVAQQQDLVKEEEELENIPIEEYDKMVDSGADTMEEYQQKLEL